jgi:uncharacterized membrane protein YcjF (UPF0283 family)
MSEVIFFLLPFALFIIAIVSYLEFQLNKTKRKADYQLTEKERKKINFAKSAVTSVIIAFSFFVVVAIISWIISLFSPAANKAKDIAVETWAEIEMQKDSVKNAKRNEPAP